MWALLNEIEIEYHIIVAILIIVLLGNAVTQ